MHFQLLYSDELGIKEKIETIAKEIYGTESVSYQPQVLKQIAQLTKMGLGNNPVCMAKTQYSLSDNPKLLGSPKEFELSIRDLYASAGAGFIVALTGSIMTMPGLPKEPAAYRIDIDNNGTISGLF